MQKLSRLSLIFSLLLIASSCSIGRSGKPMEVDNISGKATMDIRKFFNGDLEGFSIIQDEKGKINDTQTIRINGRWEDNKGVVQQNVVLSDGTKDSRTWLFTFSDDTFEAVGHDIAKPAKGRQVGNALQMNYTLSLPHNGVKREVNFEDRIYMVDEKSAIMVSKFRRGYGSYGVTTTSLKKLNHRSESKAETKEPEAETKSEKVSENETRSETRVRYRRPEPAREAVKEPAKELAKMPEKVTE